MHILLAIVPVHVREYLLVAYRQDIERNNCVATGCELPWNTDVGLFRKCVVWPSKKRDHWLCLSLCIFKGFLAQLEGSLLVFVLLLKSHIEGLFSLGLGESQLLAQLDKELYSLVQTGSEAHYWRENLLLRNLRESLLDVIWQALCDRTEVCVNITLMARHVAVMRQQDVICLFVQDILHCSVGNLCREAVGGLNPCDAGVRHIFGKDCLYTQLVEIPSVEWVECIDREGLRNAHCVIPLLNKAGLVRSKCLEHKVVTLIHKVADLGLVEQLLLA